MRVSVRDWNSWRSRKHLEMAATISRHDGDFQEAHQEINQRLRLIYQRSYVLLSVTCFVAKIVRLGEPGRTT
jgi:hypothetical protein